MKFHIDVHFDLMLGVKCICFVFFFIIYLYKISPPTKINKTNH